MSENARNIARKIADHIRGTCTPLATAVAEIGEDENIVSDSIFCAELDRHVFECECCNWWYEISEMAEYGEWICQSCAEEY